MSERKTKIVKEVDNSNSEGYFYDPEYIKNTKNENDFFRSKEISKAFTNKDIKKNK